MLRAREEVGTSIGYVPRIAWPDIETGLAAVLRDTAAGAFADWDEEFFERDIAVARVAIIGEVGRAGGIERWTPRFAAKTSPLGLKFKLAAYLRQDYSRKGTTGAGTSGEATARSSASRSTSPPRG